MQRKMGFWVVVFNQWLCLFAVNILIWRGWMQHGMDHLAMREMMTVQWRAMVGKMMMTYHSWMEHLMKNQVRFFLFFFSSPYPSFFPSLILVTLFSFGLLCMLDLGMRRAETPFFESGRWLTL